MDLISTVNYCNSYNLVCFFLQLLVNCSLFVCVEQKKIFSNVSLSKDLYTDFIFLYWNQLPDLS